MCTYIRRDHGNKKKPTNCTRLLHIYKFASNHLVFCALCGPLLLTGRMRSTFFAVNIICVSARLRLCVCVSANNFQQVFGMECHKVINFNNKY